jgi:hypothetical protein
MDLTRRARVRAAALRALVLVLEGLSLYARALGPNPVYRQVRDRRAETRPGEPPAETGWWY